MLNVFACQLPQVEYSMLVSLVGVGVGVGLGIGVPLVRKIREVWRG